MSNTLEIPMASRWNAIVVVGTVLAIVAYFILGQNNTSVIYGMELRSFLLLGVISIGGAPLVLGILKSIFKGDFGTDVLAAVSILVATWLGEYLAGALIVLMLSGGQALEAYAMRKASAVLLALASRMPAKAHRKIGGRIEDIALSDIQIGDLIVIYPHEAAVVDGEVVEGHGGMDEAYLTGEPYQISKAPGSAVISGAMNGEAVLVVRADKLPQDSRYAKIMGVMQEAEQKRPQLRRIGDQIGSIFSPLALIFAVATLYFTGDEGRFLAVLVVATPCPLLIAIPITIISAISMCARRGIIIKDPTVLERLPMCRTAIFDKTGTLTYGAPTLVNIEVADGIDKEQILQQAASLERYSKHPLAEAVLDAAKRSRLYVQDALQVSEKPGQGLTGTVAGVEITVTHRRKILKSNPEWMSILPAEAAGLECLILQNGQYAATFQFRDAPRKEGKNFIDHLGPQHQFQKIMLVSGDRESEVDYLAKLLGITDTLSSQTPEQKLEIVRQETAKAPTLFMGDGINDAPALTAATVGIAFGQANSVTAEAAGAVIMDNTLVKVDELIHISAAMRAIVLQSAIGGMILSFAAMGFAAAGYITPVGGALLQEAIDVLAIVNALRLTWSRKVEPDIKR